MIILYLSLSFSSSPPLLQRWSCSDNFISLSFFSKLLHETVNFSYAAKMLSLMTVLWKRTEERDRFERRDEKKKKKKRNRRSQHQGGYRWAVSVRQERRERKRLTGDESYRYPLYLVHLFLFFFSSLRLVPIRENQSIGLFLIYLTYAVRLGRW